MKDKAILQKELSHIDKEFAHIIKNIPPQPEQPPVLTPYWLHIEIMERYKVLLHADITTGDTVLEEFVQKAGGVVTNAFSIDIGLPHYLSYMPKEYIDRIQDESTKRHLLKKWRIALTNLKTYGEEHPPVGIVKAER